MFLCDYLSFVIGCQLISVPGCHIGRLLLGCYIAGCFLTIMAFSFSLGYLDVMHDGRNDFFGCDAFDFFFRAWYYSVV